MIAGTAEGSAGTDPPREPNFRLFARAIGAIAVNRVSCGLLASGEVCADTSGTGIAGGFWPRGTIDQYIFASGLQVAGIVGGARPENPWAGDTTGVRFYSTTTRSQDVDAVRPIFNATDPGDLRDWPAAAMVPDELLGNLYAEQLRNGRPVASQGDVWWLTWDGAALKAEGRSHPLGLVLETRGMAWNFPSGNEDILYFVFTVYNITSTEPSDYVNVRQPMKEILLDLARQFQAGVLAGLGETLPPGGYPIENMYMAFAADMDVGDFGNNYASVNVPFGLGYTYDASFEHRAGWTFDPVIFHAPFFAGVGFAGVKFLSSPPDTADQPLGLTTFNVYGNGGASSVPLRDPANITQLYRYLSATLDPLLDEGRCNTGNPIDTHICFVHYGQAADLRFNQSTGPLSLDPGQSATIAVAYIFAAPVALASCTPPCNVIPGNPAILDSALRMQQSGVNQIDSMTGYLDFTDANGDGKVEQKEFRVVPGSLLGKALVAQAVFDAGFLLPNAPTAPEFFLVPGDGQVTVLWKPADATADPYFEFAQNPRVAPIDGGAPVDNPLYDPGYRQFDVEGYRVYRGRVDSPNSFTLLAQFDYAGTVLPDFGGQVNPDPGCAPELGITSSCLEQFDPVAPGAARTRKVDHPLAGPIVQVKFGGRVSAAGGTALLLASDTALTGGSSPFPPLRDSGVPFVFVDRTVRNNLRYFYVVTAFDVNSFASGPSSLESARTAAKSVTPAAPASNYVATATIRTTLLAGGEPLDTGGAVPSLNPQSGRFSGPFPPANDFQVGLAQLVPALLSGSGSFSLRLDSLRLGSPFEHGAGRPGEPVVYYLSTGPPGPPTNVQVAVVPGQIAGRSADSAFVRAVPVDAGQERLYAGGTEFWLSGRVSLGLEGAGYAGGWGAGCAAAAPGFGLEGTTGCEYNGARWFNGPSPQANETRDHPQASHPANAANPGPMADLGNAGALSGVATIQMPQAYATVESDFRAVEGVLGGAWRAADFNLFWSDGGLIDSVIDVTHHLAVPFDSVRLAGSWGVLNQANAEATGSFDDRPGVLTLADFTCVEPLRTFQAVQGRYPCAAPEPYRLSRIAAPGPVAIFDQALTRARTAPASAGPGFALYLAGSLSIFELAGSLPPAGSVWTLRTYVGAISGGTGAAGDRGPYRFISRPRPVTAPGVEMRVDFQVVNLTNAPTAIDLRLVHTVPDPYYVSSKYETGASKVIQFVNLPAQAIIRIYSASGVLVALLEHRSTSYGGAETWNVLSRNNQVVASGVYFYHIEAGNARRVGRFTVVNVAE